MCRGCSTAGVGARLHRVEVSAIADRVLMDDLACRTGRLVVLLAAARAAWCALIPAAIGCRSLRTAFLSCSRWRLLTSSRGEALAHGSFAAREDSRMLRLSSSKKKKKKKKKDTGGKNKK
eukprot:NODE_6460_length_504_cov_267.307350.p1 GENE.NODE_6460_length_504_cov_267.307350~~NODE_6460_length_504_cov_267.307350.p1  ORF type:complete len:120 (+),score=20.34 NODE_6460_length_504_cov_267.307350:115-474(+)